MIQFLSFRRASRARASLGIAAALPLLAAALTASGQNPPTIQVRTLGDQVETSWADGAAVLEQADSLAGPWTRVPGAVSPHRLTPAGGGRFFRLVRGRGSDVVGSFFIVDPSTPMGRPIHVPGVSAYLVNLAGGAAGTPVVSDVNGAFVLAGQPPGNYQLCWQAPGFVSGCSTQQVTLVDDVVYLAPEQLTFESAPGHHSVIGRVTFPDGSPLHRRDAFYEQDYSTQLQLTGTGGLLAAAKPNTAGWFILTNVPNTGAGTLHAMVEGLSATALLDLSRPNAGTLVLSNRAPRIRSVTAWESGEAVNRAAPGSTVTLVVDAVDPDGDALHYLWVPSLSAGGFVSADAPSVPWTLPTAEGIHVMHVRVGDGRGGYATARVRVATTAERLFTGTVVDSDGAAVEGADVSMSGHGTKTGADGTFTLPMAGGKPPFVLTITQGGRPPISRVFADESAGGHFVFPRTELFTGAADRDIAVTNSRGMELFLPANSLTRADGLPVVNPVRIALSTVDPCDAAAESPVSERAINSTGGGEIVVSSLSTAHVRLTDAGGAELSPAQGSAVRMALPVSASCVSNYPALPFSVGIWIYDLPSGTWSPSGGGVLRPSPIGPTPVYETVGFLPINTYTAVDPSGPISFVNLTCDRSVALPFDVRVTGPSFSYTRTVFTVPTPFVFAPSTPVSFAMLDHRQAPGGFFNDLITPTALPVSVSTKTVNLQANITTPAANGTMTVTLRLGSVLAPLLTSVEAAEPFLTHNFGAGDAATAAAYYAAIDPANQRTTLAAWATLNGFGAGDEASAVYFNAGDLGFGRRMHMRRKVGADAGTDVAFYVSNHDTVEHARTGFSPIATVAMEYAYDPAHPSHGRYTKFFAFNAAGNRVDRVNLDNNGDKFLPNLCQICHGGNHVASGTAATGWNLNAKFIPFDMESYTYSPVATAKPGAQHNAFRTMNLAIRDNTAPTAAITALINGWYGVSGTGNFNKNFVPPAWSGVTDLAVYRDVVKPACRACHTTRGLDFATPSGGVDFCGYNVCDIGVMPDAQRTFSLFWGSKTANVGGTGTPPNMPTMLNVRYGANYGTAPCP